MMNVTTADPGSEVQLFGWPDYVVFTIMLTLSALIGIYYGCFGGKQRTTSEYLLGNKNMGAFPVAMSLVASYVSGVTVLGTPSEIYTFGTQYWIIVVAILFMGWTVAYVYVPVYCKLQVKSSYEYLELRFSRGVRIIASLLFVIDEILYIPIVIYVPAVAFNQVTGVNMHLIGSIVCLVCIFYTTLGGLKAVVWTDTLQTLVMFGSVLFVVILGTINVGGPSVVWQRSEEGGRLEFWNFNPNPLERHTVWSLVIGGYFYWTAFNAVNQTMVQRYLAMPTLRRTKISILIFTIGIAVFVSVCCYTGLLIYASYHDCDPLSTKLIRRGDQLLPVFVMDTAKNLPGLPGLFIAGVFSAALSSLSTVLNSMSAVFLEDFVRGCCRRKVSEAWASVFTKCVVVGFGVLAVACLFIVEHLGGVLQVATSLTAIANGNLFGLFSLGMFFPWANTKGALVGAAVGTAFVGWLSLGTQAAIAAGQVTFKHLPGSVEGCSSLYSSLNSTANTTIAPLVEEEPFILYKLSYQWLAPLGCITVVVVGLVVSFLTGPRDPRTMDPDLFTPIIHRFLPRRLPNDEPEPLMVNTNDKEMKTANFINGSTS